MTLLFLFFSYPACAPGSLSCTALLVHRQVTCVPSLNPRPLKLLLELSPAPGGAVLLQNLLTLFSLSLLLDMLDLSLGGGEGDGVARHLTLDVVARLGDVLDIYTLKRILGEALPLAELQNLISSLPASLMLLFSSLTGSSSTCSPLQIKMVYLLATRAPLPLPTAVSTTS